MDKSEAYENSHTFHFRGIGVILSTNSKLQLFSLNSNIFCGGKYDLYFANNYLIN